LKPLYHWLEIYRRHRLFSTGEIRQRTAAGRATEYAGMVSRRRPKPGRNCRTNAAGKGSASFPAQVQSAFDDRALCIFFRSPNGREPLGRTRDSGRSRRDPERGRRCRQRCEIWLPCLRESPSL